MKLKKIAEFQNENNSSIEFDKMVELLNKYDQITLKTWFSVDIKLGVISLIFNENLFANQFNFDVDYLEKIIEKTNSFTKNINIDFKFLHEKSESTYSPNVNQLSSTSKISDFKTDKINSQNNFSSTMPTSNKKFGVQSFYEKSTSSGFYLIRLMFNNFLLKITNKYLNFFEINFWDTREYLKGDLIKNLNQTKFNENLFIFTLFENQIFVGPYFQDIEMEKFKMNSYSKECLQIVK
jgi:hypothetical protein